MKDIDEAIRQVISKDDAEFLATLEREPALLQQAAGIFQGPFNAFYKAFLIGAVVAGLFGVYSCWQFAIATELGPLLHWGAITGFCLLVIASVRVVFIMQLNTNRLLRELKRVELQVALLASKGNAR